MSAYLTPYLAVQVACLAVSLRYLRGAGPARRRWGWHRAYLAVVVAVELAAVALRDDPAGNHRLYNLFLPVEGLFMGWFMRCLLREVAPAGIRRAYSVAWAPLASVYAGELAAGGIDRFATYTVTALSLLVAMGGVLYLALLVRNDGGSPVWRHAPFWWVLGVAVFYTGTLLAVAGLPFLWEEGATLLGSTPYAVLFNGMNAVQYGAWMIAFRCLAGK